MTLFFPFSSLVNKLLTNQGVTPFLPVNDLSFIIEKGNENNPDELFLSDSHKEGFINIYCRIVANQIKKRNGNGLLLRSLDIAGFGLVHNELQGASKTQTHDMEISA